MVTNLGRWKHCRAVTLLISHVLASRAGPLDLGSAKLSVPLHADVRGFLIGHCALRVLRIIILLLLGIRVEAGIFLAVLWDVVVVSVVAKRIILAAIIVVLVAILVAHVVVAVVILVLATTIPIILLVVVRRLHFLSLIHI